MTRYPGRRRQKLGKHETVSRSQVKPLRSRKQSALRLAKLYKRPLSASRTGALFSAFPYPTKISPEAIALFIASHTNPGDTVFDGFAGSGTTGIAALLCGNPSDAMREQAKALGLNVQWGARRAVLREIGVLGSFVADTLCAPPDPETFRGEAERILLAAENELAWLYEARDPDGNLGKIRYVIWSDVVECPNCGVSAALWDGSVRRKPAKINAKFSCPTCSRKTNIADIKRLSKTTYDEILGRPIRSRMRRPVWLYGSTGTHDWSRAVTNGDKVLLRRIVQAPLPSGIPIAKVPWGDLYRSGYHFGISHLHHFYTRRNLIAFARLWELASASPLRDALRFWLLSYNASHATIMTRVVAKQAQRDLVVTSAQSGVLYVSGLPVEKNLFSGLRRKLSTIHAAFQETYRTERFVEVQQGSSLHTELADQSVDYIFTDPPFGGNIPYGEINFINEAWLGEWTNSEEEVTISRAQQKKTADYQLLMTRAFLEVRRVLRNSGKATVVFHSASSAVWNALSNAYKEAGLAVEMASILNKTQGSFKQVTTLGSVKGDPVLLLTKERTRLKEVGGVMPVINELLHEALVSSDPSEYAPQRLYSRFVTYYLTRQENVPLDARKFYELITSKRLANVDTNIKH